MTVTKAGIIGAMDVEAQYLRDAMAQTAMREYAGMTFYEGTLGGVSAVVVTSGVGKVNAALCAQILVDHFDVSYVINTGVAGSLDAEINIGDVVISTDALQHDVHAENFGYAPGEIPGMNAVSFAADQTLVQAACDAVAVAAPDIRSFVGRVVSGDQFICDDETKHQLASTFGGMCCEMEGAAIAQTCTLNKIPFVIVRAISDKADGSDAQDYPTFEAKAAHDCAHIVEALAGAYRP